MAGSYQQISNFQEALNNGENFFILKHSATCPVSAYAKNQVDSFLQSSNQLPVYLVIVQNDRQLSNEIASTTGVKHESPQLLRFENGSVKGVLNHHEITVNAIENQLA